ncbi:heavy-metal-associated domain-containing protein [uncultured Arthrobacter sp.]|uniref:heavy-metal-associated domain-containing protein n=1 Tax=uncultured Arthrobacter sp. TaxID=114050 RepID=UPI0026341DD1|nr:heavy metal-associated domain-containing protein [uncultured Arthrobacter sp.]
MCGTTSSDLTLTDKSSSGCACCATQETPEQSVPAAADDVTANFAVTGMTCGSCASRVTSAISAIGEVKDVRIDLVSGGASTVTVLSNQPVPAEAVRSAVEQAGYQLINA